MKLKTLNDHNAKRTEIHKRTKHLGPIKNGIECPRCKKELYDIQPELTISIDPPIKQIWCKSCKHTGYRVA